ncbi:MAG: hypothetical protein ACYSWW_27905 [Planctomycetota bacterium]|jgi:hypothetical protein
MKIRKKNAKTRLLLVFTDEFMFLGLPDRKDAVVYVGVVEGDPLSYIGVPKEIRQRVKVESTDKRPLELKTFKNATSMFITLLGTREDIKIIDECLHRFWSVELEVGHISLEELEVQWNNESGPVVE